MEGPQAERVLADEGPLGQPHRRSLLRQARGSGRQGEIESVKKADRAQDVPLVGGEVGQGAGDEGREVVVEVGRLRGAAGAPDLQETCSTDRSR